MGGGGVENYPKMRDVIYGRPLKQLMTFSESLSRFISVEVNVLSS